MTVQLEKVFLGTTPSEQRKWITAALGFLRDRGFSRVVVPCCGQLSLVRCALHAGFPPASIEASDISLLSSLLGYLYSGRPLRELPVTIGEPYARGYRRCRSDIARAAYLCWAMKVQQLRTDVVYENELRLEYIERADHYLAELREGLRAAVPVYDGISYSIRDLRDVVAEHRPAKTVVLLNPPAFANGYTKMFDFGDPIVWDPEVAEFDLAKEYDALYAQSAKKPELFFWYRNKPVDGYPPAQVVYGKEFNAKKAEFWLTTKPRVLAKFPLTGAVTLRRPKTYQVWGGAPTLGPDDEIPEDAKVEVVDVPEAVGLYYRDLWAHKMASTTAERFLLFLVDGKVFSTAGVMLGQAMRLVGDRVYETYGFSIPSNRYPRINRLLMLLLTCEEFAAFIREQAASKNRLYEITGLQTTCLSKYRKVKLNNGILDLRSRKKLPNGMYHLIYDAPFRPESYRDCVRRFLEEEACRDGA